VANPAERNSVGGLIARGGGKPVRKRMPRKYRYCIPLAIRLMMLDDEDRYRAACGLARLVGVDVQE